MHTDVHTVCTSSNEKLLVVNLKKFAFVSRYNSHNRNSITSDSLFSRGTEVNYSMCELYL